MLVKEDIDLLSLKIIGANILAVIVDSMFLRYFGQNLLTHTITALPYLDIDDLSHWLIIIMKDLLL